VKRLTILLILAGCGGGSDSPPKPPTVLCSAFLQWEAPTTRRDGTSLSLSELKAFTIYVSESPDPADMLIELVVGIEDANLISWEVRNLTVTQHYFWVTATDTENRESSPSNVEDKVC
jgi:hypothetical protein